MSSEEDDTWSQPRDLQEEATYRVYAKRWVMLGLFAVPSMVNAFIFLSFGAVSDEVEEQYGVSTAAVNVLGQVFYVIYPLCLPSALLVLSGKRGLRDATLFTAVLNTIGVGLRLPAAMLESTSPKLGFALIVVGNILAAVTQPFFMGSPTLLSAKWFADDERGLATSLGALANQFGLALGYFVCRFFVTSVDEMRGTMVYINLAAFCLCFSATVLAYFHFEDHPECPPCATANIRAGSFISQTSISCISTSELSRWQRIMATIRMIWRDFKASVNNQLCLLIAVFGFSYAIYWSFALLLDSIMSHRFTSTQIAISGTLLMVMGIPGMWLGGVLLDRTGSYRGLVSGCLCCIASLMVALTGMLARSEDLAEVGIHVHEGWRIGSEWLYLVFGLLGLFFGAMQPIAMEMSVEVTFPLSEEISSIVLCLSAGILGMILIFVSEGLALRLGAKGGAFWCNALFALSLSLLAVIFPVCASGRYKRQEQRSLNQEAHSPVPFLS